MKFRVFRRCLARRPKGLIFFRRALFTLRGNILMRKVTADVSGDYCRSAIVPGIKPLILRFNSYLRTYSAGRGAGRSPL